MVQRRETSYDVHVEMVMTEKPLVINLTTNQEYKLRLEYVNSQQFDDSYNGYKNNNIKRIYVYIYR